MAEDSRIASIADASKPNAGRMYDFFLGGNHNFEVDRLAAQEAIKNSPGLPKTARSIRWFLGEAVRRLLADGFTQFIDFASGLPTVDHIHQIAPKKTKVVYSDIDPVTVAYGQEIIKDDPNVRYIACNIATPEHLLKSPEILKFLDKSRKTAFGMNGVAWFIKDEELGYSLRTIYDWADKGSRLFISDYYYDPSTVTEAMKRGTDQYAKIGQPYFLRSEETILKLCHPWKLREPGFKPLEDWLGTQAGVGETEKRNLGGFCIGAILEK